MSTSELVFIITATLSWVTFFWVLYRARSVNRRTLKTWGFIAFFGASVTVQIEPIYLGLTQVTGINNLAWLLSYCFGAIATYLTINALHYNLNIEAKPTTMRWLLYVTLASLLLTFPFIAQLPTKTNHAMPATVAEMVFMIALYAFGLCACFSIARTFFGLQKRDTALASRLRWFVIVLAGSFGGLCFAGLIIYNTIVFTFPELGSDPWVQFILKTSQIAFVSSSVWVFFFLPSRVFSLLVLPCDIVDKLLTLRELTYVQDKVTAICPPVSNISLDHGWRGNLANLDFQLYRAVIVILDGKKALSDYFSGNEPIVVADRQLGMSRTSTQIIGDRDMAWQLYQLLNAIPESADFRALVNTYRLTGRQLRRGQL